MTLIISSSSRRLQPSREEEEDQRQRQRHRQRPRHRARAPPSGRALRGGAANSGLPVQKPFKT